MAASNRWPKERRLRKREDFVRLTRGPRVSTKHFFVNHSPGTGRVGITVTKRVGNAVVRNRLKRQVRDVARRTEVYQNLDIVVVAKKTAANLDTSLVEHELLEVFSSLL